MCVFLDMSVEKSPSEASSLSEWSPSRTPEESSSGSDSTIILESNKAQRRQLIEDPPNSVTAQIFNITTHEITSLS